MAGDGKIALVTGGGRGIGRAIALELGKRGYSLAINYSKSGDAAEETCAEIRAAGQDAQPFQADVSDPCQVREMFKNISDTMGNVDVLINNAGITRDNLVIRMKDEEWDRVISSNLSSVYYCSREALKKMVKARWGRIINLASVVALIGNAGQANYVASKSGIIGLTKTIAREYGARGITVNAVAPGFIETDMTSVLSEEVKNTMLAQIPLGRPGKPEDIAKVVSFLSSDDAAYITGQVIAIDGGMTMC
ncbi:MAG TPA: 3-oxoacyl-[acyl-carrier-protein] reductase [Synergistales bacterium]|nr:3-oxoacyl-[acyl-carrier-protein] reductase [Synergistales bacterium]